jgi:hypothetical protein
MVKTLAAELVVVRHERRDANAGVHAAHARPGAPHLRAGGGSHVGVIGIARRDHEGERSRTWLPPPTGADAHTHAQGGRAEPGERVQGKERTGQGGEEKTAFENIIHNKRSTCHCPSTPKWHPIAPQFHQHNTIIPLQRCAAS